MPESSRTLPVEAHREFAGIRPGHFWFQNRYRALKEVIGAAGGHAGSSALEVGCGDGYLLPLLPGPLRVGVDLAFEDLLEAKKKSNAILVRASASELPFRIQFALVCAFDVVEHVDDDVEFLRSCAAVLSPRGRLIIATPSGPELWSSFDVYAGHRRRYTRETLRRVVEDSGLKIEEMFPMFRFLRPLAWVNARTSGRRPVTKPASDFSVSPMANWFLRSALRLEWIMFGRSPWGQGTSWVVVAANRPG